MLPPDIIRGKLEALTPELDGYAKATQYSVSVSRHKGHPVSYTSTMQFEDGSLCQFRLDLKKGICEIGGHHCEYSKMRHKIVKTTGNCHAKFVSLKVKTPNHIFRSGHEITYQIVK